MHGRVRRKKIIPEEVVTGSGVRGGNGIVDEPMRSLPSVQAAQIARRSPTPASAAQTSNHPQNLRDFRINQSLVYISATTDLGLTYPEVPLGGSLTDVLNFAQARNLPAYRVYGFPLDSAVIVYCWLAYPIVPIPLAFVYIDSSLRDSSAGWADFFVYQFLLNLPTQMSPLTLRGRNSDKLSLLSPPDALWTPFIPPAPYWPSNGIFAPNPYLLFQRGGIVPVDASGLAAFVGAFV
jgi:hypothetical protein